MTDNTNAKMLAMQKEHGPLLEVKDLAIDFTTDTGKPVHAVRDANFTVYPGQWVAIVGESGSGKSTSAMAVLGLLPGTGHVVNGSIKLDGEEIAGAKQSEFDKLRGTRMGLVPQDPMSNLNPVWRIGTQVKEALKANNMDVDHEKRSALAKALAGDEVEVKGNDDETFLGAKELPELMTEAKKALTEAGVSGEAFDKAVARFTNEWFRAPKPVGAWPTTSSRPAWPTIRPGTSPRSTSSAPQWMTVSRVCCPRPVCPTPLPVPVSSRTSSPVVCASVRSSPSVWPAALTC